MLKNSVLLILLSIMLPLRAAAETPTLADLAWMAGAWQTNPGEKRQTEEHWTQAAGATMLGMSRTVAGEKTIEIFQSALFIARLRMIR